MSRQIEVEIETKYLVDFRYDSGTRDRFSTGHGNWLPGDAPEIIIEKICISHGIESFDVTKYLSADKISEIEEACWDDVRKNPEL